MEIFLYGENEQKRNVKLVVEFVFDYVQQTVVCIVRIRMNENDHNWH